VRNGIEAEQAKKIQQLIKGSKLKVQAAIQGDAVRVTGAKRDDLQAAMAMIRTEISDFPLSFNNFATSHEAASWLHWVAHRVRWRFCCSVLGPCCARRGTGAIEVKSRWPA
jgi:hypothetical protein